MRANRLADRNPIVALISEWWQAILAVMALVAGGAAWRTAQEAKVRRLLENESRLMERLRMLEDKVSKHENDQRGENVRNKIARDELDNMRRELAQVREDIGTVSGDIREIHGVIVGRQRDGD